MNDSISFSKFDRFSIFSGTAIFIACLYFLFSDSSPFWEQQNLLSRKPKIGTIAELSNDTRKKSAGALVWFKTQEHDNIHLGDSIYSGANSHIHVELEKNGKIDVGENSLITFTKLESEDLANLVDGNFRLNINGTLKIAVNGEVTTLHGDGNSTSQVQLFLEKNKKPVLKVLSGQVSMKNKQGKQIKIETAQTETLEIDEKIAPPVVLPDEELTATSTNYIWQLYDIYAKSDLELKPKLDRPREVQQSVHLKWSAVGKRKTLIQIADNPDFKDSKIETSNSGQLELETVYLGTNHWRISLDDGQNWSMPKTFKITGHFLTDAEPRLKTPAIEAPILSEYVTIALDLVPTTETTGYVVEASLTPEFQAETSKSFWSPDTKPKLSFYKPGTYYYRFRSVTKNQEISEWSKTQTFNIFAPELPTAPVLAKLNQHSIGIGEKFKFSWKSKSESVITEILTENDEKIASLSGLQGEWIPTVSGNYKLRAFAINEYQQPGPHSKVELLKVQAPLIMAEQTKEERKPAAEEAIKTKNEVVEKLLNANYSLSQFSIKGFVWNLQSSQQFFQSQSAPLATGLSLEAQKWWTHWGVQGLAKFGIFALNQAAQQTSMKDYEARLHYRIFTQFPFKLFRELQTSFFTGYEVFQNSGSLFANQYELIKFGTSLQFPISSKWSSGGEFVYGTAADQSWKQEISGNVHYYLSEKWSAGVGYRLNFFQAGSAAKAPGGLMPYREGYTEGYTIINYNY